MHFCDHRKVISDTQGRSNRVVSPHQSTSRDAAPPGCRVALRRRLCGHAHRFDRLAPCQGRLVSRVRSVSLRKLLLFVWEASVCALRCWVVLCMRQLLPKQTRGRAAALHVAQRAPSTLQRRLDGVHCVPGMESARLF